MMCAGKCCFPALLLYLVLNGPYPGRGMFAAFVAAICFMFFTATTYKPKGRAYA